MGAAALKTTGPSSLPANDLPELRTMKSLWREFGFTSLRAMREWCRRRKIPYRSDGGLTWVDRNAIVAAIEGKKLVLKESTPPTPTLKDWVDGALR